jgi:hypothetical protein
MPYFCAAATSATAQIAGFFQDFYGLSVRQIWNLGLLILKIVALDEMPIGLP